MQEQPPYKITPDQGWAQMANILEREMPIAKQPRRIAIYWWSAAAVLTAGLIAFFALLNNSSTIEQVVTDNKESVHEGLQKSNTEKIAGTQLPASTMTGTVDEQLEENTTVSSGNTFPSELIKSGTRSVRTDKLQNDPKNINEEIVAAPNTSTAEIVGVENLQPQSVAQNFDLEKEAIDSENTVAVHTIAPLDILPSLHLSGLSNDIEEIQANIKPVVKKEKLIAPYITASVMDGYLGGLGVHTGIGANVNVMPRLSIQVGTGFNMFSPSVSFLGVDKELTSQADADNILREDLGYNGIGTYLPADALNSSAGNVITPFINTILQWQATLGLKYKLSRKFSVEGGATFTFGTTSSSIYPIVELDNSNPTNGFFKVTNSFDGYEVLRSNSTLFYAGLGFKLSPKFEFSAQWNHALEPYLINTPATEFSSGDRTDYIRGLNLGLRYFL